MYFSVSAVPLLIFLLFVRTVPFGNKSWLVCAEERGAGGRALMELSLGDWMGRRDCSYLPYPGQCSYKSTGEDGEKGQSIFECARYYIFGAVDCGELLSTRA